MWAACGSASQPFIPSASCAAQQALERGSWQREAQAENRHGRRRPRCGVCEKAHGGLVERDDKQPGKPVVKVWLTGTTITDDDLKELAPLKNLTGLYLSPKVYGEGVTGVGLKYLIGLEQLTHLGLSKTNLTEPGLKELVKFKNLTHLDLGGGEVGFSGAQDSWLKELVPLSNLTFIDLEYARVTDEGLKSLASLPKLQSINLARCRKITDAGFKELISVKNLIVLSVSQTGIKDRRS